MLPIDNNQLNPPLHLSPSSLATFEQCPLKFKFSKIDSIPDKPGIEAVLGNFVHDVLECLYKLEPAKRTKASARDLAREVFYNKYSELAMSLLHRESAVKQFRWQAWFCIDNLWKVEDPTQINPLGLETELNHSLGGVILKGFIDRHTQDDSNDITISDYKTGRTPRAHWISDKFEQLRIYAAIMQDTQLFPVTKLELIYLKDGVKFSEEVTQAFLSATIERIVSIKASIDSKCKNNSFEPVKSKLCDWCSYKKICPAWNH